MHRYCELVGQAIDNQGLTLKEVAEKCSRVSGGRVRFDITTLSRLRADKQNPPLEPTKAEEISPNRVLARVLGIPEDKLVLAAALEHTPEAVLNNINLELTTIVGDLHKRAQHAVTTAQEMLRQAQESVAESAPKVAKQLGDRATALQAYSWKLTESAALLVLLTAPYLAVSKAKTRENEAPLAEEDSDLLKAVSANALIGTLAATAGIPENGLRAYVKAAQSIEEENRQKGRMMREALENRAASLRPEA